MASPAINSTTPGDPKYLWMGEPEQRGTFGILAICISTLIICVWSTVHFNIPDPRRTPTHRFFTQVLWMVIALIAPEFLLFIAINERISAAILVKKTLASHPQLAKPGMFTCIYNYICELAEVGDKRYHAKLEQKSPPTFGCVHSFYAIMGGFAFIQSYDDDITTLKKAFFALPVQMDPSHLIVFPSFSALIYIMEYFPHLIANIPEEAILDRAQSNGLSKALLIVQVGWFCTNCASRLIQYLPLSLLEISTAAHAFCTLLTYLVWWSKPLNVPAPIIIVGKEAQEVCALIECQFDAYDEALEMARRMAAGDSSILTEGRPKKTILAANALHRLLQTGQAPEKRPLRGALFSTRNSSPGFESNHSRKSRLCQGTIVAVSPILYGLTHLLAWNDHFPTTLECRLWRVSSVVVTCSGFVGLSIAALIEQWRESHKSSVFVKRHIHPRAFFLNFGVPLAHVLASGFLIIESIRQLFFLDLAVYQLPSWSNYWPHLT